MILLHASTAFLLLVLVGGQDPLWSPKVWWAKYLSNDLYTAGQLSANMVKFAQEGGFQSIISLTPLKTSYEWGHQEVLLNTTTQRRLANELGLYFELIRTRDSRWMQYSTIETFSEYYWKAPKPVLLHCDNSYAATFVGLAFFAKETMETGNYTDASEVMDTFYRTAAAMGFDFMSNWALVEIVQKIVGSSEQPHYVYTDVSVHDWYEYYWPMKPVGGNWYLAGQIQSNHIQALSNAGINSIVNTREGPIKGSRTLSYNEQEPVNLLNINDDGGLFSGMGRQSSVMLRANRINPFLPNTYISGNSSANYQSVNQLEFGDWVGYNEDLERETIEHYSNDYSSSRHNSEEYGSNYGSGYYSSYYGSGGSSSFGSSYYSSYYGSGGSSSYGSGYHSSYYGSGDSSSWGSPSYGSNYYSSYYGSGDSSSWGSPSYGSSYYSSYYGSGDSSSWGSPSYGSSYDSSYYGSGDSSSWGSPSYGSSYDSSYYGSGDSSSWGSPGYGNSYDSSYYGSGDSSTWGSPSYGSSYHSSYYGSGGSSSYGSGYYSSYYDSNEGGWEDSKKMSAIEYYHTPTGGEVKYDDYRKHRRTWRDAADWGRNVLVHGRGFTDPAVGALLAAGMSRGWNTNMARQRAAVLGLHWHNGSQEVTLLQKVLGNHVMMTAAAPVNVLPSVAAMLSLVFVLILVIL